MKPSELMLKAKEILVYDKADYNYTDDTDYYICHAIEKADGSYSGGRESKACRTAREAVLDKCFGGTVYNYIRKVHRKDPANYESKRIQGIRHILLNKLIKEFQSKGE